MAKPRIAFTAGLWGEGAVVCRTLEDSVGSSVMQEFGLFETWTEANTFADKLNEGLGLRPDEVREIVTGALLALPDRFHAPIPKSSFWYRAPVLIEANSLQFSSSSRRWNSPGRFANWSGPADWMTGTPHWCKGQPAPWIPRSLMYRAFA